MIDRFETCALNNEHSKSFFTALEKSQLQEGISIISKLQKFSKHPDPPFFHRQLYNEILII